MLSFSKNMRLVKIQGLVFVDKMFNNNIFLDTIMVSVSDMFFDFGFYGITIFPWIWNSLRTRDIIVI
jgi:hypothetical protein